MRCLHEVYSSWLISHELYTSHQCMNMWNEGYQFASSHCLHNVYSSWLRSHELYTRVRYICIYIYQCFNMWNEGYQFASLRCLHNVYSSWRISHELYTWHKSIINLECEVQIRLSTLSPWCIKFVTDNSRTLHQTQIHNISGMWVTDSPFHIASIMYMARDS